MSSDKHIYAKDRSAGHRQLSLILCSPVGILTLNWIVLGNGMGEDFIQRLIVAAILFIIGLALFVSSIHIIKDLDKEIKDGH
jgi:hypothetical protein